MFSLFTPRYLKQGRHLVRHARKLLAYRRDLLNPAVLVQLEDAVDQLRAALRQRDRAAVQEAAARVEERFDTHIPAPAHAGWVENIEVICVAITLAVGVRAFFVQPFTIPTGSMQPTLNGIIGTPQSQPPPSFPQRAWEYVVRGRNYIDVVAQRNEMVIRLVERRRLRFFTFTDLITTGGRYAVHAPAETLARHFGVMAGREYKAGEIIARGHVDAGDMVFVDKFSYNFVPPRAGEVFVFKTTGIQGIEAGLRARGIEGSQYYIKRLAGLPGDELRIEPPFLYRNGRKATEPGFVRVMSEQGGYRGYAAGPRGGFLATPDNRLRLPPHRFFALGDNSYNSSDSRYWGMVPEENITGRGFFVYWPFRPHFGLIR